MARKKDPRQQEEEKKPNFLVSAAKIAAGAGIGYVAVKKGMPKVYKAQAKIGSNETLHDVTNAVSSVAGATVDTMGGGNQGFLQTPISFGKYLFSDTDELFKKNLQARQIQNLSHKSASNPRSLRQLGDLADQTNKNKWEALNSSTRTHLSKILKSDEMAEQIGKETAESIDELLKQKKYHRMINSYSKNDKESFNKNVDKFLRDNQYGSKENANKRLGILYPDEKRDVIRESLENAIEQAKATAKQEKKEFEKKVKASAKGKIPKKENIYADELNYRNALTARAARNDRMQDSLKISARDRALSREGFFKATMDDAKNFELKNGQTLDKMYSRVTRKGDGSTTVKSSYVDRYMSQMKEAGYNPKKDGLGNDIFAHEIYINKQTGEHLDFGKYDKLSNDFNNFMQENLQIPFLNFNIQDLSKHRLKEMKKNAPLYHVNTVGEITSPFLDYKQFKTLENFEIRNLQANTKILDEDIFNVNGELFGSITDDLKGLSAKEITEKINKNPSNYVKMDNVVLENTYTGVAKKHAEILSGRTNIEVEDRPGAIKRFFGAGQEKETIWSRANRAWNKFDDPYYSSNLLTTFTEGYGLQDEDILDQAQKRMYSLLYKDTRDMSASSRAGSYDSMSEILRASYKDASIDMFDLTTEEGVLSTAEKIISGIDTKKTLNPDAPLKERIAKSVEDDLINKYIYGYKNNPEQFSNSKRFLEDNNIISSEMLNMFHMDIQPDVSAIDDMKKNIEQLALAKGADFDFTAKDLVRKSLAEGTHNNQLEKELYGLESFNTISYFHKELNKQESNKVVDAAVEFKDFILSGDDEVVWLNSALKNAEGILSTGRGKNIEPLLNGSRYQPRQSHTSALESYNQFLVNNANNPGENPILETLMSAGETSKDYLKQFKSVFGSSKNYDNLTTLTTPSFFFANRLDEGLASIGLGLSNDLKQSPQAIYMNQFLRKIAAPWFVYQQFKWLDGQTGDLFSDTAADTYVNMHKDVAGIKEKLGINGFLDYWRDTMPGLDQIESIPLVKAFNAATFGLFSDTRSEEEVDRYYRTGEDPIRKGRNWGIGSNSMYMGDKVDRFEPNWYRKLKSDYMFSENMYGSEKEYWANSAVPTLTNPLAPIRHFITDPYHYENKHKDSRPYAVTGGFAEFEQIPIVGPLVNATVGQVLKPTKYNPKLKESHKEYLRAYNESLVESYVNMNTGGVIEGKPGGAGNLRPSKLDVNLYDEDGNYDVEALEDNGTPSTGRDRYIASVYAMGNGPEVADDFNSIYKESVDEDGNVIPAAQVTEGYVKKKLTRAGYSSRQALQTMNNNLTDANSSKSISVSQAGNIENPDILYNLDNAMNPNALFNTNGAARKTLYNMGEMAGMYGFLTKAGLGWDEKNPQKMLQSSDQMQSYSRSFWDKELGGLGGDISEIFRRYVPRDPNNRNYYNPIRNTMPDWMPGQEYFTDFLHGDPYVKIANGEMRLPGDAYEKLYNVSKDADGNYSAFDRYRILADVAPYSDQYRVAKKEMSILNSNGMLTEEQQLEYKEIREQTKAKKQKMHLYPNKFRNADIKKETVTVKRIIDANTFLTEEYGDNPIKLAGVGVKSTDTEAIDFLQQFIKPGKQIVVGLDADAHKRVRNDMMDTMRAVVYANGNEKGSMLGLYGVGYGDNLNKALLERFDKTTKKDDGSAVSTQAIYGKTQITAGKFNEWVVHDLLPGLPIVGVFADKFLQVRSPVEAYEKELYSKNWRDWKNPINDWIVPMADTITRKNPIVATGVGYGLGYLAGRKNKGITGLIGGGIAGVLAGIRTVKEVTNKDGELWIPERRQKERDVDEYFDKIKYVKYKGLYEKTKNIAKQQEGIDLDEYFAAEEQRGRKNKKYKSYLESKKKWLSIDRKSGFGNPERIKSDLADIKEQLDGIDGDRPEVPVGSYTALALRYKDEYESTLYGASDENNFQKTYKALPAKDKQFFTEFAKASPKERQRILKLVPKNQRRIYQKQFGMDVDERENLRDYFQEHLLPDENWEGWDPSNSLDNIKVKVMKQEGIDLTEANYWDDDLKRAEQSNAKAINFRKPKLSQQIDIFALNKALRGAGLKNVTVNMNTIPSNEAQFTSNLNIEKDRSDEIVDGFREYALS